MNAPDDADGPTRAARRLQGIAFGVSAALLISLTNVFSRLHFEAGSNPVTFLLGRYALFVAVVALVLRAMGRLPRISRAHWPDLLAAGLLNVAGAASLAFAIERLQVGLAIAVLYLFPILTLLMDSAVRRRAPAARTLGALLLAFGGLVLALDIGGAGGRLDPLGIAFALGAAVGIAASFVWIEHRLDALGDGVRVLGLAAVGLAFALALAATRGGVVWPFPSSWTWITLGVATATFGTAYAAMFLAISRVGATPTSTLMNLEPPATAVLAMLMLGDRSSPGQMLGIAIVVGAVLLAQLGDARQAPAEVRSR